jgi:flagellar biosynthetic protein FlhB
MADTSDRTLPASPRRREEARRAGFKPQASLPAWAASAATAILLLPAWLRATVPAAAEAFAATAAAVAGGPELGPVWPAVSLAPVLPSVALVAASATAGLAVRLVCDGVSFQPGRAGIDLRRINPLAGLGRIFSRDMLLGLAGQAAAVAVLLAAALVAARPLVAVLAAPLDPGDMAAAGLVAWRALVGMAAAAAGLAVVPWLLARRRFERRIRMTPQEFADEAKDMQADPRVRLLQQQRKARPARQGAA